MKKIKNIAVSLIIMSSCLLAQNDLRLSDAISKGLENNYQIRIVKQSEQIADENNSWGTAGRFPSLDVSFTSQNRLDHTIATPDVDRTTYGLRPSANLNWMLFNGFQIFYQKSQLEDLYLKSEGNTAVVVENTIQAIVLSYYNILLQKEKVSVFDEIYNLSKDRYDKALLGKELGNTVTFEVLQAQNSMLQDRSNFLNQKVMYNNSVRQLNLLMGESENAKYNFLNEFNTEQDVYDLSDLKEKMLSSNSTLKNQYINEILQKREIEIARSSIFPKLNLNAGYDYNRNRIKIDDNPSATTKSYDYYANLTLSLNLFNGFNTRRAIEVAKIQHDISKIQTDEMKHQLTNTLSQKYELYNVQKELYSLAEENLAAAELNLQISSEKFKNGSINSFNYRDIQIIYLNASINRLNSIYNLIDSKTELTRLTGGIITEN